MAAAPAPPPDCAGISCARCWPISGRPRSRRRTSRPRRRNCGIPARSPTRNWRSTIDRRHSRKFGRSFSRAFSSSWSAAANRARASICKPAWSASWYRATFATRTAIALNRRRVVMSPWRCGRFADWSRSETPAFSLPAKRPRRHPTISSTRWRTPSSISVSMVSPARPPPGRTDWGVSKKRAGKRTSSGRRQFSRSWASNRNAMRNMTPCSRRSAWRN